MLDHNNTTTCEPREGSALGRSDLVGMVIGGSVIAVLYLVLLGRDALNQEPLPPESPRARATILVGAIEVQPRKANGDRWDFGMAGRPDPAVTVTNRSEGRRLRTPKATDTFAADFNYQTVNVREGDQVEVRADDIDLQFHDLIGEYRFEVTAGMIEKGELELSFGQVKRLTLRFEKPKEGSPEEPILRTVRGPVGRRN